MSVKKWETKQNKKTQCKPAREKMQYNANLLREWFSNVIEVNGRDWPMTKNILTI
jgi:hypothetical protein